MNLSKLLNPGKSRFESSLRATFLVFCVLISGVVTLGARAAGAKRSWRSASPVELAARLPARATVEKERIETEMRTATGIIDDRNNVIAAVVLITAGYSADGKYSHFLLAQRPIRLGGTVLLTPGSYVLGWTRSTNGLEVRVFDARTGVAKGQVTARPLPPPVRIESFRIFPPGDRKIIQIGRFMVPYSLDD